MIEAGIFSQVYTTVGLNVFLEVRRKMLFRKTLVHLPEFDHDRCYQIKWTSNLVREICFGKGTVFFEEIQSISAQLILQGVNDEASL
ncbi:hypothetical protein [Vibrio sp. Vb339]|uniref:hypothetical protein n=1 Tax=Vibrio sp. Vb339 TaxID=1192013 RepID=UPI0015534A3C|nr:hypothetical protein [Vibrio sp. Vb339]